MLTSALTILIRDLQLAMRQGSDGLMAVVFFVLACVLFPFGVGPGPDILARTAPGIVWVAALLATFLSLERLFRADFEDGSLELMVLGPLPLFAVVLAKAVAHWLVSAIPLIVATPVLGLLLGLPGKAFPALIVALALGTPTLSLIGAVGAALALGARRGGVLLAVLILPLYIPVLIFGVAAVEAAQYGLAVGPHLLMLCALLLGATVLAPWAAAVALRQAVEWS